MVVDIVTQTEINKKEHKLYPFRDRPFHPNLTVKPVSRKFYAAHDSHADEPSDPQLEQAILKQKLLVSKDKFAEPITGNMEYGWYGDGGLKPNPKFPCRFPRISTEITRIGSLIAKEDEKMPKKPFTGVAFKV